MKAEVMTLLNYDEIIKAKEYQDKVGFGEIPKEIFGAKEILLI